MPLEMKQLLHKINPVIGTSFGTSSVLFLVARHFLLYMIAQLIEFSPTIPEWLGARCARKILSGMTMERFPERIFKSLPVAGPRRLIGYLLFVIPALISCMEKIFVKLVSVHQFFFVFCNEI